MSPSPTPPLLRPLLKGLAGLLGLAAFLGGLLGLGRLAFQQVRTWDRFTIAINEIDCPVPPGLRRGDFLDEVQYLAGLPARLPLLEEGTARRLAQAFARHPWVERVERVEVIPPRGIRVWLAFRVPVLAVREVSDDSSASAPDTFRAVDAQGILLPPSASLAGLPVLTNRVPPPRGSAGTPWGDAGVEAAARTIGFLRPHQAQLHLEEVEATPGGLVLSAPGARILWGRPPGAERPEEAAAARKVERLLVYCRRNGSLAGQEHDVRPGSRAVHRALRKNAGGE